MANEEDYFIAANSVRAINEEQYKKLDVLIHTTEAISRSLYQSVYLIDYLQERIPVCIRESFISLRTYSKRNERDGVCFLFGACTRK